MLREGATRPGNQTAAAAPYSHCITHGTYRYSTAPQVVDIVPERPALGGCARTASIFVKAGARLAKRQSLSVFASGPGAFLNG